VGESLTLEVRNTHDAIAPASRRAETWLGGKGAGPKAVYLVLLALEELVTNCIKYAYDDRDEHIIRVNLSIEDSSCEESPGGRKLRMTVIDDGRPFDPLQVPAPDLCSEAEDRQAGGLGLFLLRQMADGAGYERRNGTNRLTLIKRME
jgi:anti-sigma regulatory factor (Ser/Thr protein kinase)